MMVPQEDLEQGFYTCHPSNSVRALKALFHYVLFVTIFIIKSLRSG